MQVPCTPPGNIIAKVNAAQGSYIRLALFQVMAHTSSMPFLAIGESTMENSGENCGVCNTFCWYLIRWHGPLQVQGNTSRL